MERERKWVCMREKERDEKRGRKKERGKKRE